MHLACGLLRTPARTTGVRKMRHLIFALVVLVGALAVAASAANSYAF